MTVRPVPLGALPLIVANEALSRSELQSILQATFYELAAYPECGSERKAYAWIKERVPAKDWPFVRTLLPTPKKTGRGRLKNSRGSAAYEKDRTRDGVNATRVVLLWLARRYIEDAIALAYLADPLLRRLLLQAARVRTGPNKGPYVHKLVSAGLGQNRNSVKNARALGQLRCDNTGTMSVIVHAKFMQILPTQRTNERYHFSENLAPLK